MIIIYLFDHTMNTWRCFFLVTAVYTSVEVLLFAGTKISLECQLQYIYLSMFDKGMTILSRSFAQFHSSLLRYIFELPNDDVSPINVSSAFKSPISKNYLFILILYDSFKYAWQVSLVFSRKRLTISAHSIIPKARYLAYMWHRKTCMFHIQQEVHNFLAHEECRVSSLLRGAEI